MGTRSFWYLDTLIFFQQYEFMFLRYYRGYDQVTTISNDVNYFLLVQESGVNVLSAIKTNQMYRRSSKFDVVKDFLQPNITEVKTTPIETW